MASLFPGLTLSPGECNINRGTPALVITWTLLSIGIVVVGLRLDVRFRIRHNAGWDDHMTIAALLTSIICAAFFTKMIISGMGRHIVCLPERSLVATLKYGAILEALHVLAICMIKMSVCFALLRLVDRARRRLTQFLWFLLAFVVVTHLALALVFFLHCRPLAALWDFGRKGSCMSTHTAVLLGYIGFAIDIATDLVCAAIPLFVINKLQMNKRTKICLCILMGLGVFTAVCAAAKMATLRGVFSFDVTYGFTAPATWAAVEQFTGIIITSAPALRSIIASSTCIRPRKQSSFHSNGSSKLLSWPRSFFRNKRLLASHGEQKLPYSNSNSNSSDPLQEKSKTRHMFWYRSRSSNNNDADPVMGIEKQTVISTETEERLSGSTLSYKLETGESWSPDPGEYKTMWDRVRQTNRGQHTNHLRAWSLPNISDRESRIFALPPPMEPSPW